MYNMCGGSILSYCKERSRHWSFTAKNIKTVLALRVGTIDCMVNGPGRHSADLPQGSLEVPCSFLLFILGFIVEKSSCHKYSLLKNFLVFNFRMPAARMKIF